MKTNETIMTFDALASTWDKKHSLINSMVGNSERLLSLLPRLLFPNARIADWGCGTGKITLKALESKIPLTIYSLDGSSKMLSVLRQKLDNYQFEPQQNVVLMQADLSKNIDEIPNNSLDCILMQQVLHHLGDTTNALSIAQEKLKSDGVIIELVPGEKLFYDVIGKKHTAHDVDPLGRYDLKELVSFNKAAGLTPVLSFDDDWTLTFNSHDDFDSFIEENSIAEKFKDYKTINIVPDEIEQPGKRELSGNYITLIVRKSRQSENYDKKLKDAYSKWATNYTTYALEKISNRGYQYSELADKMTEWLKIDNTSSVLDIGAGTGIVDQGLLKKFPKMSLYGIDVSPDMLEQNIVKTKYTRLINQDATSLPFKDESFDGILTTFMLHHSFSIDTVLHEAYRVLKKGSRLAIVDFTIDNSLATFHSKLHSEAKEYGAGASYFTCEELANVLENVGFTVRKIQQIGQSRDLNHTLFLVEKETSDAQ